MDPVGPDPFWGQSDPETCKEMGFFTQILRLSLIVLGQFDTDSESTDPMGQFSGTLNPGLV